MTRIVGNTYPVKDKLKAMGARWNAAAKCWMVPEAKAAEAQALVGNTKQKGGYAPRTCCECGCKINYGKYCGKCEYR
jgi:hypothetical protein